MQQENNLTNSLAQTRDVWFQSLLESKDVSSEEQIMSKAIVLIILHKYFFITHAVFISQMKLWVFSHVSRLGQSHSSENIWWNYNINSLICFTSVTLLVSVCLFYVIVFYFISVSRFFHLCFSLWQIINKNVKKFLFTPVISFLFILLP